MNSQVVEPLLDRSVECAALSTLKSAPYSVIQSGLEAKNPFH